MASYQEILSQIEDLKRKAQEARRQEMTGAIGEIKRLMAEFGISAEDLGFSSKVGKAKTRVTGTAKYRDPASNRTWSGRGRRPGWVAELEQQGKSIESCRI
jgi:DNA-binding protein H-NS